MDKEKDKCVCVFHTALFVTNPNDWIMEIENDLKMEKMENFCFVESLDLSLVVIKTLLSEASFCGWGGASCLGPLFN